MIEILQFVFQSFWTFLGTLMLLYWSAFSLLALAACIGAAIDSFRGKR